jgi:hypothetical protein
LSPWLQNAIAFAIIVVTLAWVGIVVADIFVKGYRPPNAVYFFPGIVVGSVAFRMHVHRRERG